MSVAPISNTPDHDGDFLMSTPQELSVLKTAVMYGANASGKSNLMQALIRERWNLFNREENNPKHAQLIFTTHHTTLMRNDILRRDQI